MLFWSFVLAFVLSVLYYMSPVHNTVQVEEKPLADTLVATFVNAHQAAKRLTYTDTAGKKTITKQCVDIDSDGKSFSVDCIDAEGNPIEIEVEDTSKRVITFTYKEKMHNLIGKETSGFLSVDSTATATALDSSRKYSDGTLAYIDQTEIEKILPGVSFDEYDITSAFACITNVGTDGVNNTTVVPYLTFDCQGGKGGGTGGKDESETAKTGGLGDYVITYMQAPKSEGLARNELWRSGILRRTKGSHECGVLWKTVGGEITVYAYGYKDSDVDKSTLHEKKVSIPARKRYDETSPYIMDNSRRFTVSVPSLIGDVLAQESALAADMSDGYLLFCITPMDDIRASFVDKCKRGYGKYKIVDTAPDRTQTPVWDCTGTGTTTE